MKRMLPILLLLGLMPATGCEVLQPAKQPVAEADVVPVGPPVLPADAFEGWERAIPPGRPVKFYIRKNLYLALKDKSQQYLDYGFRRLEEADYRPNLLGEPTVAAEAYMMDLPLHAYGIWSVERQRTDKMPTDLGVAAHLGKKEASFWKGNYFCRFRIIRDVDDPEEVLAYFIRTTAANIAGQTQIPILSAFPADNRTPAGDSYFVKDLLGYDFLGRGFTVEYSLDGKKAVMFLAILPPAVEPDKEDAEPLPTVTPTQKAYVLLRRALLADESAVPEILPGPWDHGYQATHPKLGRGIVTRRGLYIAGVFGAPDDDTAVTMTSELMRRLP